MFFFHAPYLCIIHDRWLTISFESTSVYVSTTTSQLLGVLHQVRRHIIINSSQYIKGTHVGPVHPASKTQCVYQISSRSSPVRAEIAAGRHDPSPHHLPASSPSNRGVPRSLKETVPTDLVDYTSTVRLHCDGNGSHATRNSYHQSTTRYLDHITRRLDHHFQSHRRVKAGK